MDNYTKMCDHPLIQDGWMVGAGGMTNKGLVVGITASGELLIVKRVEGSPLSQTIYHIESVIWLPSIEQLMGMVERATINKNRWFNLFKAFGHWLFNVQNKGLWQPQELWLAFVMHELHNLKWTGSEWARNERN